MQEYNRDEYRPNVCAVILNQSGDRVLLCHRYGFRPNEGWQFPQGGYDPQLDLIDEMKRELREEITCDSVEVLKISEKEYPYDFPKKAYKKRGGYIGQRQTWVLTQIFSSESAISVNTEVPEFDYFKWVTPLEAIDAVVDFKRWIYEEALEELGVVLS